MLHWHLINMLKSSNTLLFTLNINNCSNNNHFQTVNIFWWTNIIAYNKIMSLQKDNVLERNSHGTHLKTFFFKKCFE